MGEDQDTKKAGSRKKVVIIFILIIAVGALVYFVAFYNGNSRESGIKTIQVNGVKRLRLDLKLFYAEYEYYPRSLMDEKFQKVVKEATFEPEPVGKSKKGEDIYYIIIAGHKIFITYTYKGKTVFPEVTLVEKPHI